MHGPSRGTVVLCHGCFDLLHIGHIRHLQEARKQGDRLIVSVTSDPHVRKGIGRPHFTAAERMEALRALDCVDEVILSDNADAVTVINRVKPAVYVKGPDYADKADDPAFLCEMAAVREHGGRTHLTRAAKVSSSRLLNGERFPAPVIAYLDTARQRGFLDQIKTAFRKADELKIAFVGENIIDDYRYVRALGKPSKEFILATVADSEEQFRGGIDAAAKHCDWPNVRIVTGGSWLTKTRYVDADFNRKLFEVYSSPYVMLNDMQRADFHETLSAAVRTCDVVVVMDFGHGLIEFSDREVISHARFAAVNAQTNAGNVGFNPVTLYPRADLICIDEPEARLATGMQTAPVNYVPWTLSGKVDCRSIIVTRGRNGCLCYDRKEGMTTADHADLPALAMGGVDTIGAGDAFLAAAGPLAATGLDLEVAAFVGNVAGAIKTTIVGHRSHVGRAELMQNIEALLA